MFQLRSLLMDINPPQRPLTSSIVIIATQHTKGYEISARQRFDSLKIQRRKIFEILFYSHSFLSLRNNLKFI